MHKLLKFKEIAVYLQVKSSVIHQWTHQGYIPHVKLGNQVRFRISRIDKWLDKKEIKGGI
jgi:excisionase family DNA binding protein